MTGVSNSYFSQLVGYDAYLNGNIAQTTFSYDSRLSSLNNSYTSIGYDRLGRLKSAVSATNAAYHVGVSPALSYDPNGNVLTLQRGTTSAVSYNYQSGTNKIAGVGANAYQHDANGNLTLSPKASLTYDAFTQMTTELVPTTGGAVKLHYNTADERVLKAQGSRATLYLHGLSDYPLTEISDDTLDALPPQQTQFIYGIGGLIATQRAGQLNFILRDHLGSTRVVVSSDGTSGVVMMPSKRGHSPNIFAPVVK